MARYPSRRSVASANRVVAQVRVRQDGLTFWCAACYTVEDGRIVEGVEHWVTQGGEDLPAWRAKFATAWTGEDDAIAYIRQRHEPPPR